MAVPLRLALFDMDNVLCDYDRERRLRLLTRLSGQPPAAILAAIWRSGFEGAADAGLMSAEEYLAGFGARLGRPLSREAWIAARRDSMTPWPEVLALVERVRERTIVAVLSNNGFLLAETIDAMFPALRPLFGDNILVSARFGIKKPKEDIYRRAAAEFGVSPQECFFTDDKPWNVAGAERAGMVGHVFAGREGLEQALRANHLLD
jgi:HAD superfamily hydrolase (TIGR01509 family)